MFEDEVYMYILCRTDLLSMSSSPGLSAAQCCHAANQCISEIGAGHLSLKESWEKETGKGFGTTITLSVNNRQLYDTVALAKENGIHAGITHDPSYPLKDGKVTHFIPLDTCGYIFGKKKDLFNYVGGLSLVT